MDIEEEMMSWGLGGGCFGSLGGCLRAEILIGLEARLEGHSDETRLRVTRRIQASQDRCYDDVRSPHEIGKVNSAFAFHCRPNLSGD